MMEKWNRRDRRSARWKEKREAWTPLLYKLALGIKYWYVIWRRGSFTRPHDFSNIRHFSLTTEHIVVVIFISPLYIQPKYIFFAFNSSSPRAQHDFFSSLRCSAPSHFLRELKLRRIISTKSIGARVRRERVCMQKKILRRKQWEEFLVSLILNRLAVIASSYGEVIKAVASVIIYAFIDDICIFGNSKEKIHFSTVLFSSIKTSLGGTVLRLNVDGYVLLLKCTHYTSSSSYMRGTRKTFAAAAHWTLFTFFEH